MDRIPLQSLLDPCAAEGGVGRNLEYDSRHIAMCEMAEGKPEQEYGQTLVAAQEPDWRRLRGLALELCTESRDLRAAVYLTESLCRTQGFVGLADGLQIICGWTTQFWPNVYPQLDPSDDDDPVERLGALNRLCRGEYLLAGVSRLPLAKADLLGQVTLHDLKQVNSTPEERAEGLTREEIQAIFLSASPVELRNTADSITQCIDQVKQLRDFLDQQIGTGRWDAAPLLNALRDCSTAIENACAARISEFDSPLPLPASEESCAAAEIQPANSATAIPAPSGGSVSPGGNQSLKLVISTRKEAMAVLDSLCDYFEMHEPASPVPLLLQRAKRLIPMSFVDILRELAPDGLMQAMQSVGASREFD